jgi:NadR type nicotinamide-nucleotide adenylyltransferase
MAEALSFTKSGNMLKRIAITGPESTGKSRLAKALSVEFNEPWVPEYARTYLEQLNRPYEFEDILEIARGQFRMEEEAAATADQWLFCDTDFLATRIWSLVKYGKSHSWIDEMADNHIYAHYLLCDTDLPWEADPLREHPHFRDELFKMYLAELQSRNLPFSIVKGTGDARLRSAMENLCGNI